MPRICNVGGGGPLPFYIRASSFKGSTGKGTGTKNVLKSVCLGLSLVSNLLSTVLLL